MELVYRGSAKGKGFQCEECGLMRKAKEEILNHIRFVHLKCDVLNMSCDDCQLLRNYHSKRGLTDHLHTIHPNYWGIGRNFKGFICDVCDGQSDRFFDVERHARLAHRSFVVRCTACHKTYQYKYSLLVHYARSHKKNPECFYCDEYLKAYMKKSGVEDHVLGHATDEMCCDLCSKTLYNRAGFRTHLNRVHAKKKEYYCDECLNACTWKNNAWKHIKAKHPLVEHQLSIGLICDLCSLKFKNRLGMITHIFAHGRRATLYCDICSGSYVKGSMVFHHWNMHVKGESSRSSCLCDICDVEIQFWRFNQYCLAIRYWSHFKKAHMKPSHVRLQPKRRHFWLECDLCPGIPSIAKGRFFRHYWTTHLKLNLREIAIECKIVWCDTCGSSKTKASMIAHARIHLRGK